MRCAVVVVAVDNVRRCRRRECWSWMLYYKFAQLNANVRVAVAVRMFELYTSSMANGDDEPTETFASASARARCLRFALK